MGFRVSARRGHTHTRQRRWPSGCTLAVFTRFRSDWQCHRLSYEKKKWFSCNFSASRRRACSVSRATSRTCSPRQNCCVALRNQFLLSVVDFGESCMLTVSAAEFDCTNTGDSQLFAAFCPASEPGHCALGCNCARLPLHEHSGMGEPRLSPVVSNALRGQIIIMCADTDGSGGGSRPGAALWSRTCANLDISRFAEFS